MIKSRLGKLRVLTAIVLLLSLALFLFVGYHPTFAQNNGGNVNYKKKVVSVLYDNSNSMNADGENRIEMAKYSLEILANLLDKNNDTLYVCPMNDQNKTDAYKLGSPFKIDLKNLSREIESKIINNDKLLSLLNTPAMSIIEAIKPLTQEIDGHSALKKDDEINNNDKDDTEYWLVILTDGGFSTDPMGNRTPDRNPETMSKCIEDCIKDYSNLKTIYLCFGNSGNLGDQPIDLRNDAINEKYPFSAYYVAANKNNYTSYEYVQEVKNILITNMQDIANKISGRYDAAKQDAVTVNGNNITVNVGKLGFAISDIAVLIQNSNAKINLTGNSDLQFEQEGSLIGFSALDVKNGSSAVISSKSGYMYEGEIQLNFDGVLDPDSVSVLVKPALFVDAYIEREKDGGWEKVDVQIINSEMKKGDKIRVNYDVRSSAGNEIVDLKNIFTGENGVAEKITYDGESYEKNSPIPLKSGNKAISVEISVLGGSYTMYANLNCFIEENDPTTYRIESRKVENVGGNNKKVNFVYTIIRDGRIVPDSEIGKYKLYVTAESPDNRTTVLRNGGLLNKNNVEVTFDGTGYSIGDYTIKAIVTEVLEDETDGASRYKTDYFTVLPGDFEVICYEREEFKKSAYLLEKGGKEIEFGLRFEGSTRSFEDPLVSYRVLLDNKDVTAKCRIVDGKLGFMVDTQNLSDLSVGVKTITVQAEMLGKLMSRAEYRFEIVPSYYEVRALPIGEREVDLHNLRNTKAGVYFEVLRDGVTLPTEEINSAMESGKITIDTNPGGWITMLPCKLDVLVEEIDGKPVVACKVGDDMSAPWDTLAVAFIFANEREIKLNYNNVSAADVITIRQLSFIERLWRYFVILLILLFILHVTLYIIGFFVTKPLPKGTLVCIGVADDEITPSGTRKINFKKKEKVKWHLSRFIPFRVFKDQSPVSFQSKVTLEINRQKVPSLQIKGHFIRYSQNIPTTGAGVNIQEMINSYKYGRSPSSTEISTRAFMNTLIKQDEMENGGAMGISNWCGIVGEDGVEKVYTFIEYVRNRNYL